MPQLKKKRLVAAKIETTPGTAETLTNAEAAFNIYDAMIQPDFDVEQRQGQSAFGKLPSVVGARKGTATFKTDLQWDGTATEPAWADVFFPACGWIKSAQVYSPTTEAVGSNVKTITIALYEDGVRKQLAGCMGSWKMTLPTGKMGYIEWTFSGTWSTVADVSMLSSVSHPTDAPIRFSSGTFTFASNALTVSQAVIDSGNTVIMREDPTTASGFITALVTDRTPIITCDPESIAVATYDRWGAFLASTQGAIALNLDAVSTAVLTLAAPKASLIGIQEADRNGIVVDELTFECQKNGSTADTELTITFTNA